MSNIIRWIPVLVAQSAASLLFANNYAIGCLFLRATLAFMNDTTTTLPSTGTCTTGRDMPAEEFQRSGHALVEWISGYLANPAQYPVLAHCEPGDLMR